MENAISKSALKELQANAETMTDVEFRQQGNAMLQACGKIVEKAQKESKTATKEYIDAVIKEVDEYIQSNGNKNKYKDWNLVLRKSIKNQWSCLKDIKTVSQPKKNDDYVNVDISYIGKYGETVFDVYPRKKGQTEWTEEDKERILKEKGGKRWIY